MSDADETAMEPGVSWVDAGPAQDEFEVLEVVEVVAMHASMTAIGTVTAEEFEASQSAIAAANIGGDSSLSGCCIGMLSAESVGIHQGAAGVMVVDGDASVDQGGAAVLVAGTAGVEQGGVGVLVASEANLARSWVGFMAARNATLTDDSRVVIDARGALIIGGLLFGGLGLVAFAVFMAGKRIAERMPRLPRLPHLPQMPQVHMPHLADLPKMSDLPKLPDLSAVLDAITKLRRAS